jgi:hypothetical protein
MHQTDYDGRILSLIPNSNITPLPKDPTTKFQNNVRKRANSCKNTVPQDTKWKAINLNSSHPKIRGLVKVHKPSTPIRPIINWRNAPSYKVSQHLSHILTSLTLLPFSFNIKNTAHLMEDLLQIDINQNTRFASFDISNMYTNIPTQTVPNIITVMCKQNQIDENLTKDLLTITETVLQ